MIKLTALIYRYLPDFILKFLKKYHYYNKLKNTSESSEEDLMMLKVFINEGDSVLDIGANFGTYTKIMSQCVGNKGKVFSFEPVPETYNYLAYNIEKLKLNNVIPLNIAISDEKERVIMEVPKFIDAGDNYYEAKIVEKADQHLKTFEVITSTLVDLQKEYGLKTSFIKCDVEGHEWNVFKNATAFLTKLNPMLLVEINSALTSPDSNTSQLIDMLRTLGYSIYINKDNRIKKWTGEKKFNYYFLKDEHLARIRNILDK